MSQDPDPVNWPEGDLNQCVLCGAAIQDGVRTFHEDGGPICTECARKMFPEQTAEAERIWRELSDPADTDE